MINQYMGVVPSTLQVVYPFQFVVTGVRFHDPTVDGINPANQLRLLVYPIIYKVLYIPNGA